VEKLENIILKEIKIGILEKSILKKIKNRKIKK
jgi:hypothetical protein